MKRKITNHQEVFIKLFAKIDNIEQQIEIMPKQSIVVDDYETKTIKIFKKRGFISFELNKLDELESQNNIVIEVVSSENVNIESSPNVLTPTIPEVYSDPLKIVEDEVEKYVENGFVKGNWSEEEEMFLKKNYPTKGRKYCSTHLNRNESSVQKKINSMGLKKKKRKK